MTTDPESIDDEAKRYASRAQEAFGPDLKPERRKVFKDAAAAGIEAMRQEAIKIARLSAPHFNTDHGCCCGECVLAWGIPA